MKLEKGYFIQHWKEPELKKRVMYQIRHSRAVQWLLEGRPPQWVASQLGHSTLRLLYEVYGRYLPKSHYEEENIRNRSVTGKG